MDAESKAIGFLQESDGSHSSTRLCVVLIIVFVLGCITALIAKIHAPITVAEFCQAVSALGLFAGGVCGALYGITAPVSVSITGLRAARNSNTKGEKIWVFFILCWAW